MSGPADDTGQIDYYSGCPSCPTQDETRLAQLTHKHRIDGIRVDKKKALKAFTLGRPATWGRGRKSMAGAADDNDPAAAGAVNPKKRPRLSGAKGEKVKKGQAQPPPPTGPVGGVLFACVTALGCGDCCAGLEQEMTCGRVSTYTAIDARQSILNKASRLGSDIDEARSRRPLPPQPAAAAKGNGAAKAKEAVDYVSSRRLELGSPVHYIRVDPNLLWIAEVRGFLSCYHLGRSI
jgi:hypothetical protein